MTRATKRWGRAVCLALALILALTGCLPTPHKACRHHGGVDYVTTIGSSHFAICNDGTTHSVL